MYTGNHLKYYYTEELHSWHASIAQNTSHILANNDIVVNLDCDNFTGKNGGLFVIENMIKYGCDKTVLHQFNNEYDDGSYGGRITLSKSNFLKLGGYDENFDPEGYHDKDLLLRAQQMGLSTIDLTDKIYCNTILIPDEKTMDNPSQKEMYERNYQSSVKNITSGKLKANIDKDHIGIIDNIYTFENE